MFHPYAYTYGYVDEEMDGNHGPPLCLWSQEFYETDPSRDFVRGYTFQFDRGTASIMEAISSTARAACRGARTITRSIAGWSTTASAWRDLRGPARGAQPGDARSGAEGFERHPRAADRLHAERQQPQNDGHGIARATEMLATAGASDIGVEAPILNGGWHLLGTARMGSDPERSVVNDWGRCHDVKNLFIVDGSIWVTSGGVNPTSTIQALALYIADTIKQRLRQPCSIDRCRRTASSTPRH